MNELIDDHSAKEQATTDSQQLKHAIALVRRAGEVLPWPYPMASLDTYLDSIEQRACDTTGMLKEEPTASPKLPCTKCGSEGLAICEKCFTEVIFESARAMHQLRA